MINHELILKYKGTYLGVSINSQSGKCGDYCFFDKICDEYLEQSEYSLLPCEEYKLGDKGYVFLKI